MTSLVAVAEEMLAYVQQRLHAVTPEQFEAPNDPRPAGQLHFIGPATVSQRAMISLLRRTETEHRALHAEIQLPFGAHPNLPKQHRMLHILIKVIEELLYEDLTQTFEPVGEKPIYIDNEWDVYWVEA